MKILSTLGVIFVLFCVAHARKRVRRQGIVYEGEVNTFSSKKPPTMRFPRPTASASGQPTNPQGFSSSFVETCVSSCPLQVSLPYKPVCGSDGRTYSNAETLQCARDCNHNVNLVRAGKCETGTAPVASDIADNSNQECLQQCIATSTKEYDPVCATNGESYDNLNIMNCVTQNCGVVTEVLRRGRCSPVT